MRIIKDEDVAKHFNEYEVIVVGTSIHCVMRHGLQHDVMLDYPHVNDMNDATKYGDKLKLGTILECKDENAPTFILAYICENYPKAKRKGEHIDYLDYNALERCVQTISILYKDKKIAMPILGSSRFDGYGNKEKCLGILTKYFEKMDVDVYDYEQLSRDEKIHDMYAIEKEAKKTDINLYKKLREARIQMGLARKAKNKHVKY